MLGAATLLLSSCIREEALNAECDITGFDAAWLQAKKDAGYPLTGAPNVQNDRVSHYVLAGTDRSALDPSFVLTPGASIYLGDGTGRTPGNGVVRDFSTPQTYTVVSEDGAWSKQYEVSFPYLFPIEDCAFEHFTLDSEGKYYVYYEVSPDGSRQNYWDSGNSGYLFCGMAKTPEEFPTVTEPVGYRGNGVRLETLSTGDFGRRVNMPIAAGNLFIGEFNSTQAMLFPRQATKFGLQLVASPSTSPAGTSTRPGPNIATSRATSSPTAATRPTSTPCSTSATRPASAPSTVTRCSRANASCRWPASTGPASRRSGLSSASPSAR